MITVTPAECRSTHRAVRDTLDVIGGKWKLIILTTLLDRKRRFKELAREIGISPRILSKELQELEINNLVIRTVCNTRPITVEYTPTEHAQTLEPVINAMRDWGRVHRQEVVGTSQPASVADVA